MMSSSILGSCNPLSSLGRCPPRPPSPVVSEAQNMGGLFPDYEAQVLQDYKALSLYQKNLVLELELLLKEDTPPTCEAFTDIVRQLQASGFDFNSRVFDSATLLQLMSVVGRSDLLKVLLEETNGNVNQQDEDGLTVLGWTIRIICLRSTQDDLVEGFMEVISLLLKAGANPNIKNKDGETPWLCMIRNLSDIDENHIERVLGLLLEGGADPAATLSRSSRSSSDRGESAWDLLAGSPLQEILGSAVIQRAVQVYNQRQKLAEDTLNVPLIPVLTGLVAECFDARPETYQEACRFISEQLQRDDQG